MFFCMRKWSFSSTKPGPRSLKRTLPFTKQTSPNWKQKFSLLRWNYFGIELPLFIIHGPAMFRLNIFSNALAVSPIPYEFVWITLSWFYLLSDVSSVRLNWSWSQLFNICVTSKLTYIGQKVTDSKPSMDRVTCVSGHCRSVCFSYSWCSCKKELLPPPVVCSEEEKLASGMTLTGSSFLLLQCLSRVL